MAERVGVTPPSIYRHFADKDSLLFEVCAAQFDRLREHLDAVMLLWASMHGLTSLRIAKPEFP